VFAALSGLLPLRFFEANQGQGLRLLPWASALVTYKGVT
jgi:hypothetical protein